MIPHPTESFRAHLVTRVQKPWVAMAPGENILRARFPGLAGAISPAPMFVWLHGEARGEMKAGQRCTHVHDDQR